MKFDKNTTQDEDALVEPFDAAQLAEDAAKPEDTTEEAAQPKEVTWNDAIVIGEPSPEFLDSDATFLLGAMYAARDVRNTQDTAWHLATMPWRSWLEGASKTREKDAWGLLRHPAAKVKEGPCIVLGSSVEGARKAKAMTDMYALGLDIDSGATLDSVVQKIQDLGLTAIVYTTFSHGRSGLTLKRDDVLKKLKISRDPELHEIQDYLANHSKNRYDPDFITKVEIVEQKRQRSTGVEIVLSSPPIEKFRVIFPLKEAVNLVGLAETQQEALDVWENAVTGVAVNMLGVTFDTSCTDPSRLFFTPRHPKGGEFKTYLICGELLDFDAIEPFSKAQYTRQRDLNNPFAQVGGYEDTHDVFFAFTPSGKSLNEWHKKASTRFQIANLLEDHCSDKIRIAGGEKPGTVHIECPFEHEHSNPGEGTATMAVNALDGEHGRWTVFCRHDACQGKRPLQYLEEMLRANWFDEDLLTDELYILPGEDEDEDVTPSERAERKRDEPLTYHRISDPLFDSRLVDEDGFILKPDEARPLYKELGFNFTIDDKASTALGYRKMIKHVRDEMERALCERFDYVVGTQGLKVAIRTAPGVPVDYYNEQAFKAICRRQIVKYVVTKKEDSEKIEVIDPAEVFLNSKKSVTYGRTCFEPDRTKADPDAYNTWTGFAVEPVPGDWSLLRAHVRDVICGGDDALFAWFMTYVASLFARPGEKIPSSVALKGEQGTGKSIFFDYVRKAMGTNSSLKISNAKHLTGNFNAQLDGKLLIVAEEAFWAGDKTAKGVVKDLITSEQITVEPKYENAVTRPNRLAVVFISNEAWVVPTDGADARRFLVLDVSAARKGDSAYFASIAAQMTGGGLEAMVAEFTDWDPAAVGLTWEALRAPPVTEALRQQAGMGVDGALAILIRAIEDGVVEGRTTTGEVFHYQLTDEEPTRVCKTHLTAILAPKTGRGNEAMEAKRAIETVLGAGAMHDNRSFVTYMGSFVDGKRDEIDTPRRVPYVEFPPLNYLKAVLERFGRG